MLISFSRRFIFIHVNRAAGSSIISTLKPYGHNPPRGQVNRFVSKLGLRRDPQKIRFRAHETARGVRKLLPAGMYDDFFTAAFVRNPYSWLVSLHAVFQASKTHRHAKRVQSTASFSEYIDWEIARGKRHLHAFVTDEQGDLMVDFIGRFENLKEDHRELCQRLSIPATELPHRLSRKHADYREYYDDATREKVARHWRRDLELFGYDFEGLRDVNLPRGTPGAS